MLLAKAEVGDLTTLKPELRRLLENYTTLITGDLSASLQNVLEQSNTGCAEDSVLNASLSIILDEIKHLLAILLLCIQQGAISNVTLKTSQSSPEKGTISFENYVRLTLSGVIKMHQHFLVGVGDYTPANFARALRPKLPADYPKIDAKDLQLGSDETPSALVETPQMRR